MKIVQGNLVSLAKAGEFDMIAHGCNCFCTMGAGIAKVIRREWPQVYQADCATEKGDKTKLGKITAASVTVKDRKQMIVVNAYTQYRYGCCTGRPHVDYDAIYNSLVAMKLRFPEKSIGLPKIGCGLAGGSWSIVKDIFEEALEGEDVTVVLL